MSLFIHEIQAKPQDSGLYGMPCAITSFKTTYPTWEHEFLISAIIIALVETNPENYYSIEVLKNRILVLNRTNLQLNYLYLESAYFNDGVYYYATGEDLLKLNQIKRKHKIETILE